MEKYARQAVSEGIKQTEDLRVLADSEIFRVLNLHYNRNNHIEVSSEVKMERAGGLGRRPARGKRVARSARQGRHCAHCEHCAPGSSRAARCAAGCLSSLWRALARGRYAGASRRRNAHTAPA